MPIVAHYIAPRIAYLSFQPAMIFSSSLLLFPPVFLLGATSPLFIALQSHSENAGKISGMVYAISTLGGILSTFFCGFFLIPELGLKLTVLFFGGILFVSTALIQWRFNLGLFLLFLTINYLTLKSLFLNKKIVYSSDSIMGQLQVLDEIIAGDTIRYLKINDIVQSEMNLSNKHSVSAYVSIFDSLTYNFNSGSKALVLGLGAGLTSNLLIEKKFNVKALEFDERIIQSAKKYFNLNSRVKTIYSRCPLLP